jgi:hypothetical protein
MGKVCQAQIKNNDLLEFGGIPRGNLPFIFVCNKSARLQNSLRK